LVYHSLVFSILYLPNTARYYLPTRNEKNSIQVLELNIVVGSKIFHTTETVGRRTITSVKCSKHFNRYDAYNQRFGVRFGVNFVH